MGDGRLRRASLVLVVPAAIAGLAACSGGGGHPGGATASASADKAVSGGFSATELKGALLTRVNGVGAAQAASTGKYASLSAASTGKPGAAGSVQVIPKACANAAAQGFDPAALSGAQAAAVTFKVASNGVSEVLIASSAKAASTALAGHVAAQCAKYQEKVDGKTFKYTLTEKAVTGIGRQARELNVQAVGTSSGNSWSLIYRGTGFVGTVTVIGPNASEKAVRELGQQAYAFAAKSLS
jgi:hypothetical protein